MKKLLKLIIIILVVLLFTFLGHKIITKIQQKEVVSQRLKIIPEFSFKTLENSDFSNANLKPNIPTIFIYFNTDCDFCQHEAQNISEKIELFKHTRLFFVSIENIETIKVFAKTYNLNNHNNITFLYDYTRTFSTRFGANTTPYILIYNKNKELVKKHKGQLKVEAILKFIKN